MTVEGAELADDPEQDRPRLRALELDLALAFVRLDTLQFLEEVDVPEGAPELAVGDALKTDVFLLADDGLDLAVLDRLQLCRASALPRRSRRGHGEPAPP
jgi:hypothetical protein